MPVDRFFHPRAGHSQKVTSLSDLEFRTWWTYQMAADDFGIMRRSVVVLQAANDALAKRSRQAVDRAFDRVVSVGLLQPFEHQGEWYVCQLDWQDFQKVRYPRESHQPSPPEEILQKCSGSTRELFAQRSRKTSEIDPSLPHAPAREEATANGKRLTAEGDVPKRTNGVMAGALPRNHLNHICSPNFSHCIPLAVHDKLINKLAPRYDGDRAAAATALKTWYPSVWASLKSDFVMGEEFKFWQARFDAAFASEDAVPATSEVPASRVPGVQATELYLKNLRAARGPA